MNKLIKTSLIIISLIATLTSFRVHAQTPTNYNGQLQFFNNVTTEGTQPYNPNNIPNQNTYPAYAIVPDPEYPDRTIVLYKKTDYLPEPVDGKIVSTTYYQAEDETNETRYYLQQNPLDEKYYVKETVNPVTGTAEYITAYDKLQAMIEAERTSTIVLPQPATPAVPTSPAPTTAPVPQTTNTVQTNQNTNTPLQTQCSNSNQQKYQALAPIKNLTSTGSGAKDFQSTLNFIFKWGIAVAVLLSVFMTILGGIQYMTTDAYSGKEEGKERIQAAIAGLLLALSAWLILYTINPRILKPSESELLK